MPLKFLNKSRARPQDVKPRGKDIETAEVSPQQGRGVLRKVRDKLSALGGSVSRRRTKREPVEAKKETKKETADEPSRGFKEKEEFNRVFLGVLLRPHLTEKTSSGAEKNKYVFVVSKDTNRIEVKKAVEARYQVEVARVNVVNTQGKERKRGRQVGWRPGYKKAVVTLEEGQTIEIQ